SEEVQTVDGGGTVDGGVGERDGRDVGAYGGGMSLGQHLLVEVHDHGGGTSSRGESGDGAPPAPEVRQPRHTGSNETVCDCRVDVVDDEVTLVHATPCGHARLVRVEVSPAVTARARDGGVCFV